MFHRTFSYVYYHVLQIFLMHKLIIINLRKKIGRVSGVFVCAFAETEEVYIPVFSMIYQRIPLKF